MNCCIPFRFVILMAPFFGAGGPMQLVCSDCADGNCIGPPACEERRPSGWHRDGLHQNL